MKKTFTYLKNFLLILILPVLLYSLVAVIGIVIPVNKTPNNTDADIVVFLLARGTHTDILVPLETEVINWDDVISRKDFPAPPPNSRYLAFGWGDLEFYRTTPQWEDLTFGTAFNALFRKSPTAMHLQLFSEIEEGENSIRLEISEQHYKKLVAYLRDSFEYTSEGEIQPIPGLHYFNNDAFYKAKGSFHAFKTCNTWVNSALKHSGLKACLWTPFSEGIFFLYD